MNEIVSALSEAVEKVQIPSFGTLNDGSTDDGCISVRAVKMLKGHWLSQAQQLMKAVQMDQYDAWQTCLGVFSHDGMDNHDGPRRAYFGLLRLAFEQWLHRRKVQKPEEDQEDRE